MLKPFYHIRQDVYKNTWQLAHSAGSCHRHLFKQTCYVHLCPCNSSSNAVQLQLLQAAADPRLDKLLHPPQRSTPLFVISTASAMLLPAQPVVLSAWSTGSHWAGGVLRAEPVIPLSSLMDLLVNCLPRGKHKYHNLCTTLTI